MVAIQRLSLSILSFLGVFIVERSAFAQSWPSGPVKVVVTQAAGSTPDIVCRLLADRLSHAFGQQFFVENRAGAANVIGIQAVAHANPDGNTLLFATAGIVSNSYTLKVLPYDPRKDFTMISFIAKGPYLIVANPVMPSDLPTIVAKAKANPGKLQVATDGPRNLSGLIAAWLAKSVDVEINQVPYSVMSQGLQDTIGGRVDLAIAGVPAVAPMVRGGLLTAVATSTSQRAPGFERAAPIADVAPGFDLGAWLALAAPAGTPGNIVQKLNAEVSLVLNDTTFKEKLDEIGFYSVGAHDQPAAETMFRREFDTWRKLVAAIGIEPE